MFEHFIYDIPESQTRPIDVEASDLPRYRSTSLDAILTGVQKSTSHVGDTKKCRRAAKVQSGFLSMWDAKSEIY